MSTQTVDVDRPVVSTEGLAARAARPAGLVPTADEYAGIVTEELSGREHEVLELVSLMLTTDEIAAELYLSANTIKTHVRSIMRKLGVTSRGRAVRRARDLRVL
jgi:LuxR family transcriptional regulator, maltose regulon positive regulatory protein